MEKSARNFIYWVLLIHALLLLLALGIVSVAARTVYVGARRQAIASAQQTQELLARETTAGIENYYKAVSAGLELLKPFQEEGGAASAGQSSAAGAASPAEPALASARAGGNTAPLPGAVGTRELNTWYSRSSATMPASPQRSCFWLISVLPDVR
jgi:predicted lysophospholipase L1 biosynthesis ABC-type transport system permease subunit